MKFIKLDLLTLLISLFILSSCESTSTIGLEVDPTLAVEGSLVDSITISSRTIAENPAFTNGAVRHPLGFLKDPIFGSTNSSLAMSVNLPNDAYDFGASPSLDSAILVLNYGSGFYGDSTSTYSIDVHQLTNNLSLESSFLSNRTYPYNNTLVGNKTSKIYPNTKFKVTDIVKGAADTLKMVTPQLRIKLDNNFIFNNIINQSSSIFKYNSYFQRSFNGLHVQINQTNSTGNGGIMFLDFAGSNSYLSLYFKRANAANSANIDTVNANFPIANSSNPVAASIQHDYTSTAIKTQLDNPTTQYSETYLQAMSGVKNKISFPFLKSFGANVGKIVINKAELVIDVKASTNAAPFSAAPRLSLYRYDIAGQPKNVPDNDLGSNYVAGDPRALKSAAAFGGYFNTATSQYVFVITSYLQDLLNGKTQDYGTFLASTPLNEFQVLPSIATAGRVVIGAYKKNPVAGDNIMKLNVYYTKVK